MGRPGYDHLENSPEYYGSRGGHTPEHREGKVERPETVEQREPAMIFESSSAEHTSASPAEAPPPADRGPRFVFSFHGDYSKEDGRIFARVQEKDAAVICVLLGINPTDLKDTVIRYNVFETREAKSSADPHHTPSRASSRFDEMAIYRVWKPGDDPRFPHELTHLIAHTLGTPYEWEAGVETIEGLIVQRRGMMLSTSFFQEGLAVAVDDLIFKRIWGAKSVDEWCRERIAAGHRFPTSLTECVKYDDFNAWDNDTIMPFAASFVKFLLTAHGIQKFKKVYTTIREDMPSQDIVRAIESIYGESEHTLLDHWRFTLDNHP